MKSCKQFYINGEWVDPAEGTNSFEVINGAFVTISRMLSLVSCSRDRHPTDPRDAAGDS